MASDLSVHCLLRPACPNTEGYYSTVSKNLEKKKQTKKQQQKNKNNNNKKQLEICKTLGPQIYACPYKMPKLERDITLTKLTWFFSKVKEKGNVGKKYVYQDRTLQTKHYDTVYKFC